MKLDMKLMHIYASIKNTLYVIKNVATCREMHICS